MKQGQLGAIGCISAELTATAGLYRAPDSWRVDPKEEPGGALASIGVHLIDAMIDVVGRISEVYCVVRHCAAPYGEDTTSLLLSFENGVTGLAFCSLAAARNFRLAVYASGGFAEVITPTMDVFRFIPAVQGRASHLSRIPDAEEIKTPHFNSIAEELTQFARCIVTGDPFPVPLDEVIHGVCVFDAAIESARSNKPVAVTL